MSAAYSALPSRGVAPSSVLFDQIRIARDGHITALKEDARLSVVSSNLDVSELLDPSVSFTSSTSQGKN